MEQIFARGASGVKHSKQASAQLLDALEKLTAAVEADFETDVEPALQHGTKALLGNVHWGKFTAARLVKPEVIRATFADL